jgi:tRNA/rRNA methyltransferase
LLLRTHYPGNIGSVARAMANFGVSDLVLVDPIANPTDHQARQLAAGGVEVLDGLRIMSFDDAVADCGMIVATADDVSGNLRRTIAGTPAEILPKFVNTMHSGKCALIFGPEPHGLTTQECGRAHALMTIPTGRAYSSLNLSMAVGIALYELRKAFRGTPATMTRTPAAFEATDRALSQLRDALLETSFLFGQNAEHLWHGFRHMLLRAQPTPQEVGMLHGLARQLEFIAKTWKNPETPGKPGG